MTTGGHPPPIETLNNALKSVITLRSPRDLTNTNGGPAFPVAGSGTIIYRGMTLR
ncbi:MAG: hypothetical protein ACLR9W_10610 [Enterobacter hormaechei]